MNRGKEHPLVQQGAFFESYPLFEPGTIFNVQQVAKYMRDNNLNASTYASNLAVYAREGRGDIEHKLKVYITPGGLIAQIFDPEDKASLARAEEGFMEKGYWALDPKKLRIVQSRGCSTGLRLDYHKLVSGQTEIKRKIPVSLFISPYTLLKYPALPPDVLPDAQRILLEFFYCAPYQNNKPNTSTLLEVMEQFAKGEEEDHIVINLLEKDEAERRIDEAKGKPIAQLVKIHGPTSFDLAASGTIKLESGGTRKDIYSLLIGLPDSDEKRTTRHRDEIKSALEILNSRREFISPEQARALEELLRQTKPESPS